MTRWPWLALVLLVGLTAPVEAITQLGVYQKGATVRCPWHTTGADGASITRATNGTVSVYIDGGTTEITTGVTDTEDFDAATGMHLATIATTDAAYTSGSDFVVAVKGAVIDGKSVNAFLCAFAIERAGDRSAAVVVDAIKQTTTSYIALVYFEDQRSGQPRTGLVAGDVTASLARSDQGDAGGTALTLTATCTRGAYTSGCLKEKDAAKHPGLYEYHVHASVLLAGAPKAWVDFLGTNLRPVRLGIDLTGASVADTLAAIATVQADTDDLQTRLPTALVGGKMDASVSALGAGSITASTLAAGAITATTFAANAIDATAIAASGAAKIGNDVAARVLTSAGVYKKNTAGQRGVPILMRSSVDGRLGVQGASVTIGLAKHNPPAPPETTYSATDGSVFDTGFGGYVYVPGPNATNCDTCWFRATAAGAVDYFFYFTTSQ